jgi:lysozyme
MLDAIIDLSHYQPTVDFTQLKAGGIVAIIHKATEGRTSKDALCQPRRALALQAGLLFGTYHFGTNGDVKQQIANYLQGYVPGDLCCLDIEKSGKDGSTSMSLAQAEEFADAVEAKTGRPPMIYGGGDYLRDVLRPPATSRLGRCPLWWARYSSSPPTQLPAPWKSWALWQYSCNGKVPGVIGDCDRNRFAGDEAALSALWSGTPPMRVMRAPRPLQ